MEAMQRAMANKVYQDFVPPTELVEDPECDTLLVYLPGYNKEQLRVQLTKTRNLVISGEHPVGENTWRRFQNTIPISSNCDVAKITAKFEHHILYITLPKLIASAEKQDQKTPKSNQEDQTTQEQDPSSLEDRITQQQDHEKPASTMTPELHKNVDKNEDKNKVKDVVNHKQAEYTSVERKETAEEKVKKLIEKGYISQNVEDNYDAKSVSDKISNAKETKNTAETGEMKGNGDQKNKTDSGYFATKLNIPKEVINSVITILVAIAFGLHVKYTLGSRKVVGKEDV